MGRKVNREVAVIGSGKTARDIGLLFLARGHGVTWIASPAYADDLRAFVHRKIRQGGDDLQQAVRIALRGEPLLAPPDVVIESRAEEIAVKQEAFHSIASQVTEETLLLSNSSSILPEDIGPNIAGMHFFYPAPLTLFVELLFSEVFPAQKVDRVCAFTREMGLEYTCQDAKNAFFVNRLLLPIQAETVRVFLLGAPAATVDAAARFPLLPLGQLAAADEIGLDVLLAGIENYVRRMEPFRVADFASLRAVVTAWRDAGILGKKNKRRLLKTSEADLHAPIAHLKGKGGAVPRDLPTHFRNLFLNTCLTFVENGECDPNTLSSALSAVFGAEQSVAEMVRGIGGKNIHRDLQRVHKETGISYFAPSPLLTGDAM